jgi:hypothetical protein
MKHAVLILGILAALSSCTSLPEPEGEGNSLVIGYVALDFPDGFFNRPARKIQNGIRLHFLNESQQTKFSLSTASGYYYFLANGTDNYSLESFEYEDTAERAKLGQSKVGWKFRVVPGKVVYLGHWILSYKAPKLTLDTLDAKRYKYEVDPSFIWQKDDILQYLQKVRPGSRWLDYEMVEPEQRE